MGIALKEGDYALQNNGGKKTVIQLKLTDSALRAIEIFQEELGRNKGTPQIRFNGNQGVIEIPSNDVGEPQRYTFLLAGLNVSSQIDCIHQLTNSRKELFGRITQLGGIHQKITVNANDDSYNATRKRMTLVKQQEQKTSTKVIKQPSTSKLGKNKFLHRQLMDKSTNRNGTPPPVRSSNNHSFTRSSSPLTTVSPVSSSVGDLPGVRSKTKPVLSLPSSSSSQPSASKKNLQDRVIHYLAIKPLKLQDLIKKLGKGGSIPEKSKLTNILQQVATCRTVGMGAIEYTLHKQLYSDVHSDWSDYTEEEKAQIRRKLAEITLSQSDNRKRPLNFDPKKDGSSPPQSRQKIVEDSYTNPVRKKQRVSLYSKPSPNSSTNRARSISPLEGSMPLLGSSSGAGISSSSLIQLDSSNISSLGLTDPPRSSEKVRSKTRSPIVAKTPPSQWQSNSNSLELSNTQPVLSSDSSSSGDESPKQLDSRPNLKSNSNRVTPVEQTKHNPFSSFDASEIDKPHPGDEFVKRYSTIKAGDQRTRYKSDFCAEYKEYIRLHKKLTAESQRFAEWKIDISQQKAGTEKYKKVARMVFEEYHKLKMDETYCQQRDRMHYLHRKLKYIKDLVLEFDSHQLQKQNQLQDGGSGNKRERIHPHRRSNEVVQKRTLLAS